jgi:subtilisin family serine protease
VGGGEAAYGLNVKQEGMLSPEKPSGWGSYTTYYAGTWSDQRKYEQRFLSSEGCYTGCGGVAWAMLYGWFDYKGMADLIAPSGTGNATDYLNGYAALCVYTTRGYINSYCVGKSCATNPWDMPDGYKWASIDRGVHYSIPTTYSIPCFPWKGCRNQAIQSIRYGGKPAIIGLWCTSAHYCVAYGYRYRYYTLAGVIVDTDHDFKCNLGWGGSPSWETGSVWYGNNPHFW